jgi:DNA gyrase subunit B
LVEYSFNKKSNSSFIFNVKNQGRQKETVISSAFLESQLFLKSVTEFSNSMKNMNFPLKLSSISGDLYEFENLEGLLSKLSEIGKKGYSIQRYKGLGEMNPEQLWETTLDPSIRVLREVTIADVEDIEQDNKERNLFEDLMGDQVEPRKKIIEDNALYVSNLDI